MSEFDITLIITTYNWPQALRVCLDSVVHQSMLPSEVIIADDGSTDETRLVRDRFRNDFPVPLLHVWQEDKGYRRSAILNKALRKVDSKNYVIFIDGDIILHHHFIADHARLAEPCRARLLCVWPQKVSFGIIKRQDPLRGKTRQSKLLHKRASPPRQCLLSSLALTDNTELPPQSQLWDWLQSCRMDDRFNKSERHERADDRMGMRGQRFDTTAAQHRPCVKSGKISSDRVSHLPQDKTGKRRKQSASTKNNRNTITTLRARLGISTLVYSSVLSASHENRGTRNGIPLSTDKR